MVEIRRGNPKAFQQLSLRLKELSGVETKVGWFPSARYEDGTPVAYVASVQELGHGPIPPRPFFRTTAAAEQAAWAKYAAQGAKAVLAGKLSGRAVMDGIGEARRRT